MTLAAEEALEAVETPEGVELVDEIEPDLVAEGDPVLLRQVMIGLLEQRLRVHARAGHGYPSRLARGARTA